MLYYFGGLYHNKPRRQRARGQGEKGGQSTRSISTLVGRGVPGVELLEELRVDPLEHLLGEEAEQLPAEVERVEDGPVLVCALVDEPLLELPEELQVKQVLRGECLKGDTNFRSKLVTPLDRKHEAAPDEHGQEVAHSTRRVWGQGAEKCVRYGQKYYRYLLADDGLHRLHVLADGVARVQLV